MTASLERSKRLGNLRVFGKVPFRLNLENRSVENNQTFRQLFRILPSGPNQLEGWRQMDKIRTFRICEKVKIVLRINCNKSGCNGWFKNGQYHRKDGPVAIWTTGWCQWFEYGKSISEGFRDLKK